MFFFLKLFLTVFLLYCTLKNIDFNILYKIFIGLDFNFLIIAFLIQFLLSALLTLRWVKICRFLKLQISFLSAWKNVLIGMFFNQTLPSSVGGDAVRIVLLSNFGYALPFQTIIIDRVFGLFASCFISVVGYFVIRDSINENKNFFEILFVFPILCIMMIVLIVFAKTFFKKITKIELICHKIGATNFIDALKSVVYNYKISVHVFLYSMVTWLLTSLSGFLILKSLYANPDYIEFSILFLSVLLISVIPISIGGWGIRENFMIVMMSGIGIGTEKALALSIIFGLIMLLVGLPGSVLWVKSKFAFKIPFRKSIKKFQS